MKINFVLNFITKMLQNVLTMLKMLAILGNGRSWVR